MYKDNTSLKERNSDGLRTLDRRKIVSLIGFCSVGVIPLGSVPVGVITLGSVFMLLVCAEAWIVLSLWL